MPAPWGSFGAGPDWPWDRIRLHLRPRPPKPTQPPRPNPQLPRPSHPRLFRKPGWLRRLCELPGFSRFSGSADAGHSWSNRPWISADRDVAAVGAAILAHLSGAASTPVPEPGRGRRSAPARSPFGQCRATGRAERATIPCEPIPMTIELLDDEPTTDARTGRGTLPAQSQSRARRCASGSQRPRSRKPMIRPRKIRRRCPVVALRSG